MIANLPGSGRSGSPGDRGCRRTPRPTTAVKWTLRQPWLQEWDHYRALLRRAGLTVDSVGPDAGEIFLVAVDPTGGIAGGVGLEGAGSEVLLRSLVVTPEFRGTGLGSALLSAIEGIAAEKEASAVYLLTTTAAGFFEARGYRRLDREDAPHRIRQSREFAMLCPASAVLMVKTLVQDGPGSVAPTH